MRSVGALVSVCCVGWLAACAVPQNVGYTDAAVERRDASSSVDARDLRTCGTALNPVGCPCQPNVDAPRDCFTFSGLVCHAGRTTCQGSGELGVWGECVGQVAGRCPCTREGDTQSCGPGVDGEPGQPSPCGAGTVTCHDGQWGACMLPVCPDGGSGDGGDGGDGAVACDPSVMAPRLIAPLSTATVTRLAPRLAWQLAAGTDGAHVEMCRDRACTRVVATFDATGANGRPPADLAPAASAPRGVVYWRVYGRASGRVGCAPSATWEFFLPARSATADTAWGTVLDVDGDGFAELAVAGEQYMLETGRVYVYRGGAAGVATTPAWTLTGTHSVDGFGGTVTSAGDVNGDGFADLAVGADDEGTSGRVEVFFGGAAGLPTAPSLTLRYPAMPAIDAEFGFNGLSAGGDVNGDGYADLVVGADGNEVGYAGSAYVYLGSASGLAAAPATSLRGSARTYDHFGRSIASGDVNGDGLTDVVIGEPAFGATPAYMGRAYVYLGSTAGIGAMPSVTLAGSGQPNDSFGLSIATVDANGDGLADVVVGGDGYTGSLGRVYVFAGRAAGVASTATTTLTASAAGAPTFFGQSVAAAGDVNHDGYGDLVLDAALVFLGSAAGVPAMPATTLTVGGVRQSGVGAGIGDVNADGFDDIGIGVYVASTLAGRAYVFAGGASLAAASPTVTLVGPDPGVVGFGSALY